MRTPPIIPSTTIKRLPGIPYTTLHELLEQHEVFNEVYTFSTFTLSAATNVGADDQIVGIHKRAGQPRRMDITIYDTDAFPFVSYIVNNEQVHRIKQKDNFQSRLIVTIQSILTTHGLADTYRISDENLSHIATTVLSYIRDYQSIRWYHW
jgi:hypothetical protein